MNAALGETIVGILRATHGHGAVSRVIARKSGYSPAYVAQVLADLEEAGTVRREKAARFSGGRRSDVWRVT